MDYITLLQRILAKIGQEQNNIQAYEDYFGALLLLEKQDFKLAHEKNVFLQGLIYERINKVKDVKLMGSFYNLYKKTLLFEAPHCFDSFLQYIEWNRDPNKRFYTPRRNVLLPIVRAFQEVADRKVDLLTVSQPKRTGKALPINTQVLTPSGFVSIGSLNVGNMVISARGNPTRVTGVYPQGKKEVYEITFTETGKCKHASIIECCGEHLWTVRTEEDRYKGTYRVMSTKEMMNGKMYRGNNKHNNYSVDYVKPVQFEPKNSLKISPYLMGVLLGDGNFSSGGVGFTSADSEIIEKVKSEIDKSEKVVHGRRYAYRIVKREDIRDSKGYMTKGKTNQAICDYGLSKKHSWEKFIPDDYIYSSVEDRFELLRGLFDTDGCVTKNTVEYSTTSPKLAEQVQFIVRSVGGRATIKSRMGKYKKNGVVFQTRINYRVSCQFTSNVIPFWLERKNKLLNVKRKKLYRFISDIKKTDKVSEMVCISVEDDSNQFVIGNDMILTHNTTLGLLFVLFRAGKAPLGSSICSGAGNDLVKSFYRGCLDILEKPEEYLYYDVFPSAQLVSTNADEKTIMLQKKRRFATITARSIDGSLTGSTEATKDGVLYLDDLVSDDEQANNRERLDTLWDKVRGDLLGRRLEGCPIVAQGTRYSIYDPIGRLQEVADTMQWKTKIIEIPALDPVTDESNFEIELDGVKMFTTEYYRHERELVSDVQWESQFQQQPFEAKGLMFPKDKLNYYFELPTDKDPDAIIAVCDTAESGKDSCSMPIAYLYGDDVFIEDVMFDNSPPDITKPQCAKMLIKHKVQTALFESNNAGEYFAKDVDLLVQKMGGKVSIRKKRTISNKQTRIEFASDGIIKNFYFKDLSKQERGGQYWNFMKELTTHTRSGKVKHDDAADSLSMLENEIRRLVGNKVEVIKRMW